MIRKLLWLILAPIILIFSWLLLVRIVRHFYKFPMPEFMADAITNPLRLKLQPPAETAVILGVKPGMTLLDIGPGNGVYTCAAAQQVGPEGQVLAIDIEPRMIARLKQRAALLGLENITARVGDVYALPSADDSCDLITLIAVLGEIPDPQRALAECHRVLKPAGRLAISELLVDPDWIRPSTLRTFVESAGFRFHEKIGNFFIYSMIFSKISKN